MGIRKWPKDNEPARFPDLADPIVKGIRFAYSVKRRNKDKRIPWLGPDQGKYTKVSCLSPREGLSKESLAWLLDDQGRDALDVLVAIAVQLGIEQGRRMAIERLKDDMLTIRCRLEMGSVSGRTAIEELVASL